MRVLLKNRKTGIEYVLPKEDWEKMRETDKMKFELIREIAPVKVKVPEEIKQTKQPEK